MIKKAGYEDLERLMRIQHLSYQSQAEMLNDFTIDPLLETLEDLQAVFSQLVILKAVSPDGALIGAIRGRVDGDTCHVGRLFVHPDYRGRGIASRLLAEIEKACIRPRYELFTSSKSINNIRLYEKAGYVRYKEVDIHAHYNLVFLEKYTDNAPYTVYE